MDHRTNAVKEAEKSLKLAIASFIFAILALGFNIAAIVVEYCDSPIETINEEE